MEEQDKELINEKFGTVNKRLDNCEDRLSANESNFQNIDKTFSLAIAATNQTNETMAGVLKELKEAVVDIKRILESTVHRQDEFESTQKDIKKMQEDQGEKLDYVTKKLSTLDEEGKFNIRLWIKNNWVAALLALGGIGAIISKFFE